MEPNLNLSIDRERLSAELAQLAEFTSGDGPGITRVVFSEPDLQAREWLKKLLREAGLAVREDAVGNTFARWDGFVSQLAPVGTGSHIDAIPHSGQYDGTVGVLGALEAIRALKRAGFEPQRSIELILFTSEEPTRFGIGCLGSRLLSGVLAPEEAAALTDAGGLSLGEVRGSLASVPANKGCYRAFVELHIEQGPILESEGASIGLVTAIAGQATLRIVVSGDGGHAGAVLMASRRDALSGAAKIALAAERIARLTGSPDSVATTGVCRVFPGAVNSIPSRVTLEVDVRDLEGERRDGMVRNIHSACQEIGVRRGLTVNFELLNSDQPAQCDGEIVTTVEAICRHLGLKSRRMPSRAYHDALFMARLAPSSMIFIPCRKGYSHRPDEYATPEDIGTGALILAHTLAELSTN